MLEPFLGKSEFGNHGQRVVEGQRLMQAASDIMLGWLHTTGLDGRSSATSTSASSGMRRAPRRSSVMEPNAMIAYAGLCGWTLAKAHARSGDAIAIGSYLGSGDVFDRAMADFAEAVRGPERAGLRRAEEAVDSGRVKAEFGL